VRKDDYSSSDSEDDMDGLILEEDRAAIHAAYSKMSKSMKARANRSRCSIYFLVFSPHTHINISIDVCSYEYTYLCLYSYLGYEYTHFYVYSYISKKYLIICPHLCVHLCA